MWTIKIALLAAGIAVTALTANAPAYSERCAALETAGAISPATEAAPRSECLPGK